PAGHLGKTTMVRGEPGLVAQAKVAERQAHWTSAQSLRHADHLQQAERVGYATSDVECMSRELRELAAHSEQRSYEIVDVQHVPHLAAIAENRQWVVTERASEKVGNPALVAVRLLVRPVDATHAKYHRGEAVATAIVEHVLVGGAFRAAVRA